MLDVALGLGKVLIMELVCRANNLHGLEDIFHALVQNQRGRMQTSDRLFGASSSLSGWPSIWPECAARSRNCLPEHIHRPA